MQSLVKWAHDLAPSVDFWSVRGVSETAERLLVRKHHAQAPSSVRDQGFMVCVAVEGALAYAASSDISPQGLRAAFAQARALARAAADKGVFDARLACADTHEAARSHYRSPNQRPASGLGLREKLELLSQVSASMPVSHEIVDWQASLWSTHTEQMFIDSRGAQIEQSWDFMAPNIVAVASSGGETQTRSAAGQYNGFCQQGGLEVLERAGFADDGARVAREALELIRAPNCPEGSMDVILMPDQMMLQIHESIGHPLELDRILGDERNFAGTSFVTADMFGHYRYGSALLNVTFDPTIREQFASFAYDDSGAPARREFIIRDGVLLRPLGGSLSQWRARELWPHIQGVATARACNWNRAPIDRMSNLNVEPGNSSLAEMIASIEDGVLMRTNSSWSIDDSRNKFQFGCEYGQRIRHGQLAEVVKNPNYRGVSAQFWQSLSMVGDRATFEVMGTPYCGKGEPNQVIRVGHAAPACKFSKVAVFGGVAP
jgi:predicted Zn-dependent protease